jgi:pilus assembly protein CpaB
MNTTRMAILGVALVCGVGCVAVLVHGMSAAKPKPVAIVAAAPPPDPTVRVLVSRGDLKVGQRVQQDDMTWRDWPVSALSPTYITDTAKPMSVGGGQIGAAAGKVVDATRTAMSNPSQGAGAQFVGAVVREHILPNEPVVASKLVMAGGSGVLAVTLDPGMRAVALPLTPESAAGGFIQPGDHVDVMMTRSTDSGPQQLNANATTNPMHGFTTTTVMRNVRVLAIDQNMGAQKTSSTVGATATVEASPAQAEYLVLAKASGTITLALRSYADVAGDAQMGRAEVHEPMTVRVFRGSAPTVVTVTR